MNGVKPLYSFCTRSAPRPEGQISGLILSGTLCPTLKGRVFDCALGLRLRRELSRRFGAAEWIKIDFSLWSVLFRVI
jgi:hypothetical protein